MAEPTTHTLDVPGTVLAYDVRTNDSSAAPVLLLIGSPMGAAGSGTLAGQFADRTVVATPAPWSAANGPTVRPSQRPMSTRTTCTA